MLTPYPLPSVFRCFVQHQGLRSLGSGVHYQTLSLSTSNVPLPRPLQIYLTKSLIHTMESKNVVAQLKGRSTNPERTYHKAILDDLHLHHLALILIPLSRTSGGSCFGLTKLDPIGRLRRQRLQRRSTAASEKIGRLEHDDNLESTTGTRFQMNCADKRTRIVDIAVGNASEAFRYRYSDIWILRGRYSRRGLEGNACSRLRNVTLLLDLLLDGVGQMYGERKKT